MTTQITVRIPGRAAEAYQTHIRKLKGTWAYHGNGTFMLLEGDPHYLAEVARGMGAVYTYCRETEEHVAANACNSACIRLSEVLDYYKGLQIMSDTKRDPHPTLWVHGMPARDLKQVAEFLSGDAHDQSKVQVLVSGHFYTLADMVTQNV